VERDRPPLESTILVFIALEDLVRNSLLSKRLGKHKTTKACSNNEDVRCEGFLATILWDCEYEQSTNLTREIRYTDQETATSTRPNIYVLPF
jgi:hypothetical protein